MTKESTFLSHLRSLSLPSSCHLLGRAGRGADCLCPVSGNVALCPQLQFSWMRLQP